MTLRRKITLIFWLVIVGGMFWFVGAFIYALQNKIRHIPEAYAAWDTGTLLVEYMKTHDRRWPSSWDDLLTVVPKDQNDPILVRGAKAGETNFFFSLRQKVAVNWKFDPARSGQSPPVTRLDGSKFPILFENPNQIIQDYLKETANTNAANLLPTNKP